MNKSKISPSGSGKKLVQARLPFKTLSSAEKVEKKLESKAVSGDKKIKSKEISVSKRKSLEEVVKPPAKIPRKNPKSAEECAVLLDEKENSKSSKPVEIVISDDESIFDAGSNASSLNENRDENVESKSSEASLISEADAVNTPSSKKSLKFGKSPNLASDRLFQVKFPITLGKKRAAQTESKKKDVMSKEKKKQTDKSPTEEGVVVLDESDREEEVKSYGKAKTAIEEASNVCRTDEKAKETEKNEAKAADTIDIPYSDEEPAKAQESAKYELKKPKPVTEITKRKMESKRKGPEKVVDEFDATLGLRVSDSETEMGDESKVEIKKQKSRSTQVPPEVVLKELRVILSPISIKRRRSPVQTASPNASKRATPSRKAKQTRLEAPASVVLEVSDNAMDISLSEKKIAGELDKSVDVTITDPLAAPNAEPKTPKLRSTNKPNSNITSSEKKTTMTKLQRQKEREEKEQQRLKEKEEKEEKRRKEKEEKEEQKRREKEEKEELKRREKEEKEEQRRKEKEEKEEQRKKEKEEKDRKRLAELEAKNEERRQKDEERKKREEQREEERRKKEEERRKKEQEKEEAEIKKKKAAEAFSKFFSLGKKTTAGGVASEAQKSQKLVFMPFRIKNGMKLAPIKRRELKSTDKNYLDNILKKSQPNKVLYLEELKKNLVTPRSTSATLTENYEKTSEIDSDVEIIDDDLKEVGETIEESKPIQKFRAKFLWFHENRRPPYYGTFRKKSDTVKPRRPFAIDKKFFDYEVDSDDEWEEEEIGESLHGSDDEKETESEDEYEVDNEFFVPHGHLSDEELQREDELDEIDDDDDDATREAQKEKMKLLEEEFNQNIKKRTEKIQPRLVGIVWQDENGNCPESCCEKVWTSLMARAMVTHGLIVLEPPENFFPTIDPNLTTSTKKVKKADFDAEDIKNLAILIHGNRHKRQFLIREFQAFVNRDQAEKGMSKFANVTIKNQFDKIAKWSVYSHDESKKKKLSWIVSDEVLKQYGLENIGLKNTWKYVTEPKYENDNEEAQIKDDEPKSRPSTPSVITKFTKILGKDEKDQKFCTSPSTSEQKNAFKNLEGESSKKENQGKWTKRTSVVLSRKTSRNKNLAKMKKRNIFEKKEKKSTLIETIELGDSNCDTDEDDATTEEQKSPETKDDEPPIKKRAILLSAPLGTEISENVKKEFISKSLKSKKDSEPIVVNGEVPAKEKGTEQPQQKKRVPLLSVPFGKVITEDAKKEFVTKVLTQTKLKTETPKKSENNKETLVASETTANDEVRDTSQVEDGKVSKRPSSPARDQPPAKKRVPLLSVPLGKTIPDDLKNEFVSKNLSKKKERATTEASTNGTIELSDDDEKTQSKAQLQDTKPKESMEVSEEKFSKSELPAPSDDKIINEKSSPATQSEELSTTFTTAVENPCVLPEWNLSESATCSSDVQPAKHMVVATCLLSAEETSGKSDTNLPEKKTCDLECVEQVSGTASSLNVEKTEESVSSIEKFQVEADSDEKKYKSDSASTESNSAEENVALLAEPTKLEDAECSNDVEPMERTETHKSISIEEHIVKIASSEICGTNCPKKDTSNGIELAEHVVKKISSSNDELQIEWEDKKEESSIVMITESDDKETDTEEVSTTLNTLSICQKEKSSSLAASAKLPAEGTFEKCKSVSPEKETSKDTGSADQMTTKISSSNDEKSEKLLSSSEKSDSTEEKLTSLYEPIQAGGVESKTEDQRTETEESAGTGSVYAEDTFEKFKNGSAEKTSKDIFAEITTKLCLTDEKVSIGSTKEICQIVDCDSKAQTQNSSDRTASDEETPSERVQNDEKKDVIALAAIEMPLQTLKELSTPDSSTE